MRLRWLLAALLLVVALARPAGAGAYPWPFEPFDKQHPIRGFFGDPRTVFLLGVLSGGIDGPGTFSFHQGVDIAAPDGTPIYSVSDGVAHYLGSETLNVTTGAGVAFQYFHILPIVGEGQRVVQSRTILGYVPAPFGHVHLTEIDGRRVVNPLQPGHLTPYRDGTAPVVQTVAFRNDLGAQKVPLGLCGRVEIDAQAYDEPPVKVPGTFDGLPVSPAFVSWSILTRRGGVAMETRVAADFRTTLPPNTRFWSVYARGTYENAPRFGDVQYPAMPGRYLFKLAARFDTTVLRNGVYTLVVRAVDIRGNETVARQRFSILNSTGGCPGSLPARPELGVPPTEPPPVPGSEATGSVTP